MGFILELKCFNFVCFMCMRVLFVYMYVHHVCLEQMEECAPSLRTGIMMGVNKIVGTGN